MVTITTRFGPIRGAERAAGHTFWGVRFAAPPLRFQAPVRTGAWSGTYDATEPGPRAIQPPHNPLWGPVPPGPTGEDCLRCNVHTPASPSRAPRPVIVWIHGGAFTEGSPNAYDATALAQAADAVVVTAAYRLGCLGLTDLRRFGSPYDRTPVLWLLDLLTLLTWVQEVIADFGGDPDCVTIAGESAGATAALAVAAAPAGFGLVHRVLACSPGRLLPDGDHGHLTALATGLGVPEDDVLDRLLLMSADEVLALDRTVPAAHAGPMLDGVVLPAPLTDLLAAQGTAAPPLVAGNAVAEGAFFGAAMAGLPEAAREAVAIGVAALAADGAAHVPAYLERLSQTVPFATATERSDAVWHDLFVRGAHEPVDAVARAGGRAWHYVLDVPCRVGEAAVPSTHGVDVGLTFNWFDDPVARGFSIVDHPEAPALARRWVEALAAFARTGEPGPALGTWPRRELPERASLWIGPTSSHVRLDVVGPAGRAVWRAPDGAGARLSGGSAPLPRRADREV